MKHLFDNYRIGVPNTLRISAAIVLFFLFISAFQAQPVSEAGLQDVIASRSASREAVHPLKTMAQVLSYPAGQVNIPREMIDSETLWLARAIFSETKRPEEQLLVAWVIRNRVETAFRGKRTYQSVVLDPYQFSAFMNGTEDRLYYESLTLASRERGWQRALAIAYNIRHMSDRYRPFSPETRHFYSERSMTDKNRPAWVEGLVPLDITSVMNIDQARFRFFEGIS